MECARWRWTASTNSVNPRIPLGSCLNQSVQYARYRSQPPLLPSTHPVVRAGGGGARARRRYICASPAIGRHPVDRLEPLHSGRSRPSAVVDAVRSVTLRQVTRSLSRPLICSTVSHSPYGKNPTPHLTSAASSHLPATRRSLIGPCSALPSVLPLPSRAWPHRECRNCKYERTAALNGRGYSAVCAPITVISRFDEVHICNWLSPSLAPFPAFFFLRGRSAPQLTDRQRGAAWRSSST